MWRVGTGDTVLAHSRISVIGVFAAGAGAVALLVAGCATGSEVPAAPSASASPSVADLENPVGLIAIGHSAITGEGSGSPEGSWATGTSSGLGSIYQRLIERRPETEGWVANAGSGGAPASALASQAETALAKVPAPEIVVIQTIDSDMRCDGTDADHVPEFGEDVRAAIALITDASPNSKVVVTTQRGRPPQAESLDGTADPVLPGGDEPCERMAYLTSVIESYEAEQARVCAEFPQCADDAGAGSTFIESQDYYSGGDPNHLNAAGQAAFAAHMWPAIEAILGEG